MPRSPGTQRDTLNLRIKPEVRGLIDRAATVAGSVGRSRRNMPDPIPAYPLFTYTRHILWVVVVYPETV